MRIKYISVFFFSPTYKITCLKKTQKILRNSVGINV